MKLRFPLRISVQDEHEFAALKTALLIRGNGLALARHHEDSNLQRLELNHELAAIARLREECMAKDER